MNRRSRHLSAGAPCSTSVNTDHGNDHFFSDANLLLLRGHLVELMNSTSSLSDHVEKPLRQFNHFLLVFGFEQRIPAYNLFRLGERAVDDGNWSAGCLVHAKTGQIRKDTFGGDEPPLLHTFFDEFAHGFHFLLRRWAVDGFVSENTKKAHVFPPGFN